MFFKKFIKLVLIAAVIVGSWFFVAIFLAEVDNGIIIFNTVYINTKLGEILAYLISAILSVGFFVFGLLKIKWELKMQNEGVLGLIVRSILLFLFCTVVFGILLFYLMILLSPGSIDIFPM